MRFISLIFANSFGGPQQKSLNTRTKTIGGYRVLKFFGVFLKLVGKVF